MKQPTKRKSDTLEQEDTEPKTKKLKVSHSENESRYKYDPNMNISSLAKDAKQIRAMKRQSGTSEEGKEELDRGRVRHVEGEEQSIGTRFAEEGQMIEPFNLTQEREEGYFDESGTYIQHRDRDRERDAWADALEDEELRLATTKVNKKPIIQKKEKEPEKPPVATIVLLKELVELLEDDDETVSEALNRLRPKKQKKGEKIDTSEFDKLSSISYELSMRGYMDVYSDSKENILEKIKQQEEQKKQKEQKEDDNVKWEYKWEDKPDAQVYGPFTTQQIREWVKGVSVFN